MNALDPATFMRTIMRALLPLLFILSCSAPPPITIASEEGRELAGRQKFALAKYQSIPPKELACLRADLETHFRLKPDGTDPMGQDTLKVSIAALRAAMADAQCAPDLGAVVVNLGLDPEQRFRVALEFVCMTYDGTKETYDHSASAAHYIPDSQGNWLKEERTIDAWHKTGWTRYHERVLVMNDPNSTFRAVDTLVDVRSVVYAWSLLEEFIEQNYERDDGHMLGLLPIAGPLKRDDTTTPMVDADMRQGVCWIPMGVILDDAPVEQARFRYKAANLGSPCPDHCPGEIVFRTEGLPRRPECEP